MKYTLHKKSSIARLIASTALCVGSSVASAAIVCHSPAANIPQTLDGIYINLFNNTAGATGSATAGWDFNPYASSTATLLSFNAAAGAGYVSSGGVISALPAGSPIGAANTYITGIQTTATAMGTYRAGVTGSTYLGFRFTETGSTYYGWIAMTTTGPNGFPATLNNYCFENVANTAIPAGTTPVALQQFSVE